MAGGSATGTDPADAEEVAFASWPFDENLQAKYRAMLSEANTAIMYHDRLESWNQRGDVLSRLAQRLFGFGALTSLLADPSRLGEVLIGLAAGFGVIGDVMRFDRRKALHAAQKAFYAGIMARMEVEPATRDAVRRWAGELVAIRAKDEPMRRTLMLICHNEAALAMGRPEHVYPVSWWRRVLSPFCDVAFDRMIANHKPTTAAPDTKQSDT